MLPELAPAWETLERGKAELIRRARALPPDVFTAPRKPGEWSFAQILHHMAIAENEVAGQIAALKAAETPPKSKFSLFPPLVTWLLKSGLPVPVPPGSMVPSDTPPPLDETERLWSLHRANLKARLDGLGEGDRATPIALHPIAGPMNARQVLTLADAHQTYHLRQFPK